MGCGASSTYSTTANVMKSATPQSAFGAIPDRYNSLDQVSQALRHAGLESSQLIVGIDFIKSNKWTGTKTFGGRCLHDLDPKKANPYQQVLKVVATTLAD